MKIDAQITAALTSSHNFSEKSLIEMKLTFPKFILSELLMLTARKSDIKFTTIDEDYEDLIDTVDKDPFIPIVWTRFSKIERYVTCPEGLAICNMEWIEAKNLAVNNALRLKNSLLNFEIYKVVLEPFMWCTANIIGSKDDLDFIFRSKYPQYSLFSENMPLSFTSKRDLLKYVKRVEAEEFKDDYDKLSDIDWFQINKNQSEVHLMSLAEMVYDALNESNNIEWN